MPILALGSFAGHADIIILFSIFSCVLILPPPKKKKFSIAPHDFERQTDRLELRFQQNKRMDGAKTKDQN